MKFAYFPGCAAGHGTSIEYDSSARVLAQRLGIELIELKEASCCGTPVESSHGLWLSLAVRNLALAERQKLDLVTVCSGCFVTFRKAIEEMEAYPDLNAKVNDILSTFSLEYKGKTKIRHLLDVVVNDFGLKALGKEVKTPLRGLKVAPYYGCWLLRPPEITKIDDHILDGLIDVLGAESIAYGDRSKCCGGPLLLADEKAALTLAKDRLTNAKFDGANCIVTACPLCHFMLDAQQHRIEKTYSVKIGLPVLHFTQLVGLALGIDPEHLKLSQNCVSTKRMLNTLNSAATKGNS